MARVSVLCAIFALLTISGASASARGELILPQAANTAGSLVQEVFDALKNWASTAQTDAAIESTHVTKRPTDDFYILVKYIVRPAEQKEFAKTWLDSRKDIKELKGNVRYTLSKTMTDNLILYSYQEWESKAAFYDFLKSDAVKPLAEYVEDNDIPFFLTSLLPVESFEHHHGHHHHGHHHEKHHGDANMLASLKELTGEAVALPSQLAALESHSEPRELGNAIILTKFLVRPSEAKCFVKAFLKLRSEATEEKGNIIYGLSKTLTDNLTFYSYAEWEGKEAFIKHIKSEYVKKFLGFIEEANIPIVITSLIPIEDLDRL